MIKATLFSAFIFLMAGACLGQQTFQRLIGTGYTSTANSVRPTNDGGYIITGYADIVNSINEDVYLVKTNAAGNVAWTRTFRKTSNNAGNCVQQTADGGYIIAATASDTINGQHIYIIKTNAGGDTLWTRTYGGDSTDAAYNIQQTKDGGYIAAGTTNSFGAGGDDMYVLKLSAGGSIEWTKTFGGSDYDEGTDVKQTVDSGYIVCGTTLSFGTGNKDFYLVRLNAQGDTLWTKTYGGSNFEVSSSVCPTFDGGYVITGYTSSFGVSSGAIYIVKTNAMGDTLWTKTYDGDYFELVKEIQQTTDSGYILSGYTNSAPMGIRSGFLIKTDGAGNAQWSMAYGGPAYEGLSSGRQAADGGYILAGVSASFGTYGNGAVYLVKTDSVGNSGCKQGVPGFIAGTTTTITGGTHTIVGSGGAAQSTNTIMGGGIRDSALCEVTGIYDLFMEHGSPVIYPNPAGNELTIRFPEEGLEGKRSIIYITDLLGQIVSPPLAFHSQSPIDVSPLSPGIYVLHITGEQQPWAVKFIKQ